MNRTPSITNRFLEAAIGIAMHFIGPIEKETLQEIAVAIFEANEAVMTHGDGRYPTEPQEAPSEPIILSLDAR